ncbi:hypothetical protein ACFXAZ_12065 [Streptomyces sp. NPDC059477]|uniref:hypothetical protein n=1 Tax=Streptomyces sp. NPDC059477 TaxID=3346847 RepID=UPI0036B0C1E1
MSAPATTEAPVSAPVGTGRRARPDRPVRDPDPVRNAAYWARIDRIVDAAPPLTDEQRAVIRTAFHQPQHRRAAA